MNDAPTGPHAVHPADCIRQFYAEQMAARMKEAAAAAEAATAAVRALEEFNRSERLPGPADAPLIVVWAAQQAARAAAREIEGGGSGAEADAALDARLGIAQWLREQGYELPEGFAEPSGAGQGGGSGAQAASAVPLGRRARAASAWARRPEG